MKVERYTPGVMPALPTQDELTATTSGDVAGALTRFNEQFTQDFNRGQLQRDETSIGNTIDAGGTVQPNSGMTELGAARNDIAMHAYAAKASLEVRDQISQLSAEYTGMNPTDPANAGERFDAFVAPKLDGIPDQFKPFAADHVAQLRSQFIGDLTEKAGRAEAARGIEYIKAATAADLQDALNYAQKGDENGVVSTGTKVVALYHDLVTSGHINEDQAKLELSQYADQVQGQRLFGQFLRGQHGAPTLNDAMNGTGPAASLGFKVREQLSHQISEEIGRRHTEFNASMAAAASQSTAKNNRLELYTHTLKTVGYLPPAWQADFENITGQIPDGLPAKDLPKGAAGTADGGIPRIPLGSADPEAVMQARAAYATASVARDVATATPDQLAATVAAALPSPSNPYKNEQDYLVRTAQVEAAQHREKAVADDPMAYLTTTMPGDYQIAPMPNPTEHPEQLGPWLAQAQDLAQRGSAHLGKAVPPMTNDQLKQLTDAVANPNTDSGVKRQIAGGILSLGPSAWPVFHAVAKNGDLAFADIGFLDSIGNGPAAQAVSDGNRRLMGDNQVFKKSFEEALKADGKYSDAMNQINFAFPSPLGASIAVEGMRSYAAGMYANSGVIPDAQQAAAALGRQVAPYNGKSILLPYGVPDVGTFGDRVASITAGDPARGTPPDPAAKGASPEVLAGLQSGQAKLTTLGGGHYAVQIGQTDARGFVLDFSGIREKITDADRARAANAANVAAAVGSVAEFVNQVPAVQDFRTAGGAIAGAVENAVASAPTPLAIRPTYRGAR